MLKAASILQETGGGEYLRKPPWLKVRLPGTKWCGRIRNTLAHHGLHSICQEARCPNMAECFQDGTATFLLMGDVCTRNCRYCNVKHGVPGPVDPGEIPRLVAAVEYLNLKYAVLTSVTRDDLYDGGAAVFANAVTSLRAALPAIRIEVLIPDFQGHKEDLEKVIAAGPDMINHNIEVVPSLFTDLRPQGNYAQSLEILRHLSRGKTASCSKSGFMIGFGETGEDIRRLLADLAAVRCQAVTVGQYLQPTRCHAPVRKYYHPDEFAAIREEALALGIPHVEAGPMVRSSYHAGAAAL